VSSIFGRRLEGALSGKRYTLVPAQNAGLRATLKIDVFRIALGGCALLSAQQLLPDPEYALKARFVPESGLPGAFKRAIIPATMLCTAQRTEPPREWCSCPTRWAKSAALAFTGPFTVKRSWILQF
jgi:hypothetical protein